MKVKEVEAYIIKNSRGENAIEVRVNKKFVAAAPSGASTGKYEVSAFPKKGIKFAVNSVNNYKELKGMKFETFDDLAFFDDLIPNWGADTVIAVQLAILKGMSGNKIWKFLNPKAKKFPTPLGNCVGGGMHTKKQGVDVQEFLLMPSGKTFEEKMVLNDYVYRKIGKALDTKQRTDEGAFMPNMTDTEVFDFLYEFLNNYENTLHSRVRFGIDLAASSFWNGKFYTYKNFAPEKKLNKFIREDQIDYINELIRKYKLGYVEDPVQENDFVGFSMINKKTLVCGDDLVVTNLARLKEAIKNDAVNCVIIKPNQIGSLTKTKEVVDLAQKMDINTVISHRSGETMDASIAHLAVAWSIPYIKTGIYGAERRVKLKELMKIEQEIKG
tara:strand:+ start:345 stop:1496 length:1152 start_codon:yes stop_codon:yes gene_type:complete